MMNINIFIALTAVLALTVVILAAALIAYRSSAKSREELTEKLHEEKLNSQKEMYERMLAGQKENDKSLKERQEELNREAEETFKVLTGGLDKDLRAMKESFEAQKKASAESTASIRVHLEEAVKNLRVQTENIGAKADHLASALKGRNKMQGCWGETILENIFKKEGLCEGRDYDREQTLRDEMGIVIRNEDSGKRMRPDFILHYPDDTDVIIDCKVDLSALADYQEAETDARREDAARRNLEALYNQIKGLSAKSYWDNLRNGRKTLNYVVMFVPVYGSFQLARQLDPEIAAKAFGMNVLITTEETIMPFLRMIRTAWISVEQVRNQEKIVKAAQNMVERVADLVEANMTVGKKLDEALKCQQECARKLGDDGRSITNSARQVIRLGVPVSPRKKQILDAVSNDEDGQE